VPAIAELIARLRLDMARGLVFWPTGGRGTEEFFCVPDRDQQTQATSRVVSSCMPWGTLTFDVDTCQALTSVRRKQLGVYGSDRGQTTVKVTVSPSMTAAVQ
jgi:hypothetical protein